jgi:hypothetical protein
MNEWHTCLKKSAGEMSNRCNAPLKALWGGAVDRFAGPLRAHLISPAAGLNARAQGASVREDP